MLWRRPLRAWAAQILKLIDTVSGNANIAERDQAGYALELSITDSATKKPIRRCPIFLPIYNGVA